MKEKYAAEPALGIVLVGSRPDSQSYVKAKTKVCNQVGVVPQEYILPEDASQEDVLKIIDELNNNTKIDGILVQVRKARKFTTSPTCLG